jgi:hypothetical protein
MEGTVEGKFRLIDPITIEAKDQGYLHDNYMTVLFQNKGLNLEIDISDPNLKELGERVFPNGLMPNTHAKKVALLNYLIQELGPVYDKNDQDWHISHVTYDEDGEDKLYYYTEEEK